jgi:hypothetical protein
MRDLLAIFQSLRRAVSSVVEHHLDTVGVRGSKPLPRTIFPLPASSKRMRVKMIIIGRNRRCFRKKF